jgi:hypothetical protein
MTLGIAAIAISHAHTAAWTSVRSCERYQGREGGGYGRNGRSWPMLLKKSAGERSGRGRWDTVGRCRGSGWHAVLGHRDKLGELAEVLGCGGEVELVTGAIRPA